MTTLNQEMGGRMRREGVVREERNANEANMVDIKRENKKNYTGPCT